MDEPEMINDLVQEGITPSIDYESLIWYQAGRRDALLMLLLAGGVMMWVWDRGTIIALAGSIVSGGLFLLLHLHLRQSRAALVQLADPSLPWNIRGFDKWATGIILLGTIPSTLLVGKAAWKVLPSHSLAMILALLTFGWQVWLYFWTTNSPDTVHEE